MVLCMLRYYSSLDARRSLSLYSHWYAGKFNYAETVPSILGVESALSIQLNAWICLSRDKKRSRELKQFNVWHDPSKYFTINNELKMFVGLLVFVLWCQPLLLVHITLPTLLLFDCVFTVCIVWAIKINTMPIFFLFVFTLPIRLKFCRLSGVFLYFAIWFLYTILGASSTRYTAIVHLIYAHAHTVCFRRWTVDQIDWILQ